LLGEHQKTNAALALATVEILQEQIPVPEEKIRTGLQNVDWPGRLQQVTLPDGQRILLDGAHNPAGAKTLAAVLTKNFSTEKPVLILGVLQDKDWQHICETLAPLATRIFTVPVSSERSANPDELAEACRKINPSAEIAACDCLNNALEKLAGDGFVVITGSLYLVGEALEMLGLSPANGGERGLNEWAAPPTVLANR
jgi:dihydrofolate synthase/folylpolyglutamate synthase